MEFTRYTLRNGIRCIHKQVRSAAVHCALTVGTGSRDEQPAEHGMAHLLEHAFFKGTERRRAYHINCRLENLGGELNAYTTKEETVIHTTTLRADLSKAAELIADIVFHSTFPAKELEKEKDIIVDEINSYKDSPSERIFDDFEDLVFKGSPLGHNILGSKASLMKYTRDDLKRFVARTYNTDQMVFSVIGNVSPKRFPRNMRPLFRLANGFGANVLARADRSVRAFLENAAPQLSPSPLPARRPGLQSPGRPARRAVAVEQPARGTVGQFVAEYGRPRAQRAVVQHRVEFHAVERHRHSDDLFRHGQGPDGRMPLDRSARTGAHMPGRTERAATRHSEKAIHRSDHPGHGKQRELHAQCGPQLPDLRQRGRSGRTACQNPLDHRYTDRRGGRGDILRARNLSMLLYK